ncbi:ribonuclease H-like domain-containing protein [Tanacetum coccineum]
MAESAKRHEENSNIIKKIRAFTVAAIRNQRASIKTLEIQIGQMSKVLQERGVGSLPSSTETNPRYQVKSISNAKADFSKIRRIGCGPYAVSGTQHMSLFSETIPFPRRLQNFRCDDWREAQDVKILDAYDHTLPQKEKDLGSFTLPCFFHNICFDKALVDLGASVSVMPFSTYTNLVLGILSHTWLTIELANRTIKQLRGIAKNVLVRIGKFVFLIDFIILDIPEDDDVPLILGRSFLSTAHSKIEVLPFIDDDDMTKDDVLGMIFCYEVRIVTNDYEVEVCSRGYDLAETMIWYILKRTYVVLIRACSSPSQHTFCSRTHLGELSRAKHQGVFQRGLVLHAFFIPVVMANMMVLAALLDGRLPVKLEAPYLSYRSSFLMYGFNHRIRLRDIHRGYCTSYAKRIETIWSRFSSEVEGWCLLWGEGRQESRVFMSHAWRRLFGIQALLFGGVGRRMTRRQFILALGLHTEQKIAEAGYFLGPAPSYVLIRDPVRRLCHRMIAYSISGRGQAPEKVTGVEFFVLSPPAWDRGILKSTSFRHSSIYSGMLRGGRAGPAQGLERLQVATAGAYEADKAGLAADEGAQEIPVLAQAPLPPPPAPQPRTMS